MVKHQQKRICGVPSSRKGTKSVYPNYTVMIYANNNQDCSFWSPVSSLNDLHLIQVWLLTSENSLAKTWSANFPKVRVMAWEQWFVVSNIFCFQFQKRMKRSHLTFIWFICLSGSTTNQWLEANYPGPTWQRFPFQLPQWTWFHCWLYGGTHHTVSHWIWGVPHFLAHVRRDPARPTFSWSVNIPIIGCFTLLRTWETPWSQGEALHLHHADAIRRRRHLPGPVFKGHLPRVLKPCKFDEYED